MRMHANLIPDEYKTANNLHEKNKYEKKGNGWIYMDIQKGVYGLPQAGFFANNLLKKRLPKHGYYELPHTPSLWKYVTHPITFSLVVDDFSVKYEGKEHADHLLSALREDYTVDVDKTEGLYCDISLDWNYNKGYVDISMPNYVQKQFTRYFHPISKYMSYTPYVPTPIIMGQAVQDDRTMTYACIAVDYRLQKEDSNQV